MSMYNERNDVYSVLYVCIIFMHAQLIETRAKSYSGKNSVFLVYMCLVYMCMRVLMYLYLSLYI